MSLDKDIDFKVTMPPVSRNRARRARSAYRERILAALGDAGFEPMGEVNKRDENRFFSAAFLFPSLFAAGRGLRPHIRVEMSLLRPRCLTHRDRSALLSPRLRGGHQKWGRSSPSIWPRPEGLPR